MLGLGIGLRSVRHHFVDPWEEISCGPFCGSHSGWGSLADHFLVHFPDLLEDCGLRFLGVPFFIAAAVFSVFSLAWRYFMHV